MEDISYLINDYFVTPGLWLLNEIVYLKKMKKKKQNALMQNKKNDYFNLAKILRIVIHVTLSNTISKLKLND